MITTFAVLAAIWITIALSKLYALLFVAIILAVGLVIREVTIRRRKGAPVAAPSAVAGTAAIPTTPAPTFLGQTILVAARGWTPALQFALEATRLRNAQLLVLYVREVAVTIDTGNHWQKDPHAREIFKRLDAESENIRVNKLYSVSDSPADTIIDIAATFGVDTVVLGGTRRASLVNLLKGNVVGRVAANLPESMHLIVIG